MRDTRNLTDEEIALLSSPAEKPTAQFDRLQQTEEMRRAAEEAPGQEGVGFDEVVSAIRADRDEKPFDIMGDWKVGDTHVPNLFETAINLPGGVYRAAEEMLSAVSPYHIAKGLGIRAAEAAEAHAQAGDDDELYRQLMDTFAKSRVDEGFTEIQQVLGGLAKEVVPFVKGTLANPYDRDNAELFDPHTTSERMPMMHAVGEYVEGLLPASPWDTDYNPEWSKNVSTMIEEEAGEVALELLLGNIGTIARTTRRAVRSARNVIDDVRVKGVFDSDVLSGLGDSRRLGEAATVELDYARTSGFDRGGMGTVISDPTGRTFISTAAHVVTGKGGERVRDLSGIRATTQQGDVGTVRGLAAVDLERDLALLEITGLDTGLSVSDAPLSDVHTLLGRVGETTDAFVRSRETGATIRGTTARGVAGESGAHLLTEGGEVGGVYLGEVAGEAVYSPGEGVSGLFGEVSDTRIPLDETLARQAQRESIQLRYGRGETGVEEFGFSSRAERPGVVDDVLKLEILLPQFQVAAAAAQGADDPQAKVDLHSLYPAKPLDTDAPRLRYDRPGGIESRTYGLELEFLAETSRVDLQRELSPLGIDLIYDVSIKSADPDVLVQYQYGSGEPARGSGSVASTGQRILYGHEAVFPIMEGLDDLSIIQEATEIIARQPGLELNTSQSTHTHVGAMDLSPAQLINLYSHFANYEDVIDPLHTPDRRGKGGQYTQSLRRDLGSYEELMQRRERVEFAPSRPDVQSGLQGDRYKKFHIGGADYRTVEYRQPGVTVDPAEIERNIRFATGFVERFKDASFIPRPFALPQQLLSELGINLPGGQSQLDLSQRRELFGLEEKLWKTVSEEVSAEAQIGALAELQARQRELIQSPFVFPGYERGSGFSGSSVSASDVLTVDELKSAFGKREVLEPEPVRVSGRTDSVGRRGRDRSGQFSGSLEDVRGALDERGELGNELTDIRGRLQSEGHFPGNVDAITDRLLVQRYRDDQYGDLGIGSSSTPEPVTSPVRERVREPAAAVLSDTEIVDNANRSFVEFMEGVGFEADEISELSPLTMEYMSQVGSVDRQIERIQRTLSGSDYSQSERMAGVRSLISDVGEGARPDEQLLRLSGLLDLRLRNTRRDASNLEQPRVDLAVEAVPEVESIPDAGAADSFWDEAVVEDPVVQEPVVSSSPDPPVRESVLDEPTVSGTGILDYLRQDVSEVWGEGRALIRSIFGRGDDRRRPRDIDDNDVEQHSYSDPREELERMYGYLGPEFHRDPGSRRRRRASEGKASFRYTLDDKLAEIFTKVSESEGLFLRIGVRGEDFTDATVLDAPQTGEYREWLASERPVTESFYFEEESFLAPESLGTDAPDVQREGVVAHESLRGLGHRLEGIRSRVERGTVPEGQYSLQVLRGRGSTEYHDDLLQRKKLPEFKEEFSEGDRFVFEPELLLELDIPSSAGYRGETVGQYEVNRTVPYDRGDPHFIDDTGLVELAVEATVEKDNIVEYNRVPVMPDEGSASKYDMESMGWGELQEEISYGSTYATGLAKKEMKRRRVKIAGGNERLIEGMEYEADIDRAYTAIQEEANEQFLLDQEAADYTETFKAQDYKTEGWEPAEETSLIEDDTGLVYEGWIDEYGDFEQVFDDEGFEAEGTALRPGSEGDSFDSEKITSIEALQGRDSSLRVETQGQISELFSGVIERGAQRDVESAAVVEGSASLKRGVLKEADERLPAWRELMRIARNEDDFALRGERGAFYKERIAAQGRDWQKKVDSLWKEGKFDEYYNETASVRRAAFKDYTQEMGRRRDEGIVTEPNWMQERRAAHVSDYEVLRQGRVRRSESGTESHLARPPRDHTLSPFLEKDPGTSIQSPLEIRKEAAARAERPTVNPMELFREQVYQEEAGLVADSPGGIPPAFDVSSGWADAEGKGLLDDFRLEAERKWHTADVEDKRLLRAAQFEGNVGDVRDTPVPEVRVLQPAGASDLGGYGSRVWEGARSVERSEAVRRSLREGRQPVESAETYSDSIERTTAEAERLRASQRLLQQYQADLEMWGSAQASAYEGLGGDVHAKELAALDKKSKTAKTMTLNELRRSTEQHSFDADLDVRPLDLLRPRARRRSQGLASQRTYGLELELITDLERGEMLGVFGEQVAGGLEIVDDSTIQTARPNVRVERGVDVEFASELFTDEGLSYLEDSFTLGVLAEESADFQAYQGQYTDVPGNEMLDPGDSITRYSHELVFPVMQGQEGLDLIGETYERLGQLETELNTSMGMHVHVGTKDLENYDLIGVWGAFAAREKAIDLMHEKSRQGAGHPYSESMLAGSSRLGELLKIEVSGTGDLSPQDRVLSRLEFARKSSLLSDQSRESFLDTVGYGDRYQKLNLRGSKYNTIEYRQPAASLDFAETEGHISFITDFVDEYAGTSPEWAFQKDLSLEDISSEFGLVFEEPTRPGQIVLPFDVVQHSRDAGDPPRTSRKGSVLRESADARIAEALADAVEDDVPVYEDVPPDLFDDVPMSEDFSSDLFDEAGADPFDEVPMYEESFDTQTGRAGAVPEPELEGGSVDLKGVESAVDRARAHRVPYVSDPGVDSDAVRAALAYHQSGEATYRERYGGSETYIEHVPGEGANRVIGSFSPEELAERATERHRRLRSHITGQRDDFEVAGSGADPGDVSLIGSDFDVDSGSGRTAAGRLGRWFSEQVEERSWGTGLRKLSDVGTSGAIISGAAQATVAGVRFVAGHDPEPMAFLRAGAQLGTAFGLYQAERRLGSRGVLPESPKDFSARQKTIELAGDVPSDAGQHLEQIFLEAGAGKNRRFGKGSFERALEGYSPEALTEMFGEAGTEYLQSHASQLRRFGQRSQQTQRNWVETVMGFYSGDFPTSRRYAYNPERGDVDVESGRRWSLDRLLGSSLGQRFQPLEVWRSRREHLRQNPDEDVLHRWSGGLIPKLQPEDAVPHILHMMLPEARGISRFFGRFHAEPDVKDQWIKNWNEVDIARGVGANKIADSFEQRRAFASDVDEVLEQRRTTGPLYEWQDPDQLYRSMAGTLGIDTGGFQGFGREMMGSPYDRFGSLFSDLPEKAKYPLGIGAGAVAAKVGYHYLFDSDDEEKEPLHLEDPAGYSVSARFPLLSVAQRTLPYRRLRARGEQGLDEMFGEDSFHGEMLKSIVLGKKGNLPKDVKETFVEAGQVHTLVQSGQHVNVAAGMLRRYPLLGLPAVVSAVKDFLMPPDEIVEDASDSVLDKYKLSDDPWVPRWNPQGVAEKWHDNYDPDFKPPSWAWWDTDPKHFDYEPKAPSRGLKTEEKGLQDVLPWSVYSMFGVLPESFRAYMKEGVTRAKHEAGEAKKVGVAEEHLFEVQQRRDSEESLRVNINLADVSELDRLPGIGRRTAERIFEYRERDAGGFESIEELLQIRGIGEKTFESIKPFIDLGEEIRDEEELENKNISETPSMPSSYDEPLGVNFIEPVAPMMPGMRDVERNRLSDTVVESRVTSPEMVMLPGIEGEVDLQREGFSTTSTAMTHSMSLMIEPVAPMSPGVRDVERNRLSDAVVGSRQTFSELGLLSGIEPEVDLQREGFSDTSMAMMYSISSSSVEDTSMGRFRELERRSDSAGSSSDVIDLGSEFIGMTETEDTQALTGLFESQGLRYYCDVIDPSKTPWCGAFAGSILKKGGYESLDTLTASEYRNYGEEGTGAVGDIAVWQNHVGFVAESGENTMILGGNQDDMVKLKAKEKIDAKSKFLGYRKPVRSEDYRAGGFDFNVHESPFEGFNPWLDPTPDVDINDLWDFEQGLPGVGSNLVVGAGYGIGERPETISADTGGDIEAILKGLRDVREDPTLKEESWEGDLALEKGFLYRLTHPETARQYVGLSKNHPLQSGGRIRQHLAGRGSPEIAKVLSEYDSSDFYAEVWGIEDVGYRELGYLEKVMIERTGSRDGGYNISEGGTINPNFKFDVDFARSPDAVSDVDYDRFKSAEIAIALPPEMFEEEDYFTADEESQLRGMLASRFAKQPESTGRPVQGVRRDAPEIEHPPVIPDEHRIDITQASELLLQEVPGIPKGVAERAVGFQEDIGLFQNIEGFDEIRGMSKARMVEAAPYLKLPVSAAGGSAFEDVDPVTRDATPGELLDVETATAADFRALPGIGKITAERIVADREARGAFMTPQGIGRVRGVSDSLLEDLGPYLKGFGVSEHPSRAAEGLLPNVTDRYMGDPEVQKILGTEGSEKLYGFNVENRPGFARSERIRALGEVMAPGPLVSYHDRPGGAEPYLDVDTAGWEEFKDLPGVGESLARRIVSYREQEGEFGDYRELSQVRGVSTGLIDSWKQYFEPLSTQSGLDLSSLQRLPTSDTVLDFQIGSRTPWDIDINQATLDDWRAVPGVSGRKAHDILMHQAARGDFAGVEDLHQRVGLSSDVYQRLLPRQSIDLNQASAMQLSFLPELGQERAERIVSDREERGDFESFQDLGRVEGIGSSILKRLSGYRQERVSARSGMFAREFTPYPTDMRGHIPSYEDDLDAEIAPLFGSGNIADVPLVSGFQHSLRKYQEEHGVTITPEDRRRRSGRPRQRTIDEIPVSEALGYFAESAALDAPSDLFSGFVEGAEVNSEIERRLAKLEKSQEELEREIQQDKTLTVSERTEQLGQLEDRFGPQRDRLEGYEVSASDVITDTAERAGTSILDRTLGFAGDKLIEKASTSALGTSVKAFGSKALSGLNILTPAIAPLALVAATVAVGESSLDAGYEEVIESKEQRTEDFYARVAESQSPAGDALRHARLQREKGERQRLDDLPEGFKIEDYLNDRAITFINRKLRLLDTRGVTRR